MNNELINRFSKCYHLLKNNGANLFHLTITNINAKSAKAYKSMVRSRFITPFRMNSFSLGMEYDAIIVIEYNPEISKQIHNGFFDMPIQDLGLHAHLILSTKLDLKSINDFCNKVFSNGENVLVQDITYRNDKENLSDYLKKQNLIMNDDNFLFDLKSIKKINKIC